MMFSSRRSRNRHSANPNPKLHLPQTVRRKLIDGAASASGGLVLGGGPGSESASGNGDYDVDGIYPTSPMSLPGQFALHCTAASGLIGHQQVSFDRIFPIDPFCNFAQLLQSSVICTHYS